MRHVLLFLLVLVLVSVVAALVPLLLAGGLVVELLKLVTR